ncbi:MAG: AzlD domain-containing protein [Rhodospirillales bacterium]|nr:AzlD domain-containing protein [Rhodospirillales bacterium]
MSLSDPWVVLLACIGGTFVWRALGVAVASRIDISGNVFQWFNCVAYAMLAGLITRVLLIPSGTLAETPDIDRIAAMTGGLIIYFFYNRNIFIGTGTAFVLFLCLTAARHFGIL